MKTINLSWPLLLLVCLCSINCKKKTEDSFCQTNRVTKTSISNQEGLVVFYNKYNRYAVSFTDSSVNNIDSRTIGMACDLPAEFQTVGLPVIVSGELKSFNPKEQVSPQTGGEDLYFLVISSLAKKP